jgi:hypothetical protein
LTNWNNSLQALIGKRRKNETNSFIRDTFDSGFWNERL